MYLSLIILPLLGCIVSGFFGRKVGVKGAQLITCSCVIITTILSILCFIEVGLNNIPVTINLFRWIDIEWFNIIWGFQFDSLTVSMLIPVLIISSLVHIYSISYMSSDPHNPRFFSYLSLFTFMMIILVTANNYLLMFVGWEGVGVCSYLLVSFWFTRIAANQSSISAFLANRVGDCFLTIGMFAILWSLGNLDYATVFSLAPYINTNVVIIIGICLLIGAMAKSSQVGLHIWLPMAMEGPTPVSALIHAATMVTAGVYLLMRSSPLIEYSSVVLLLCLWLGAITTVFSSLIGLFQQDIKKIIAYSTMSQDKARNTFLVMCKIGVFMHQTICVDIICNKPVTILYSQITKARDYLCQVCLRINNRCSFKFFNSSTVRLYLYVMSKLIWWKFEIISKLVGISETIRLILIFFNLKLINLNLFDLFIITQTTHHAPHARRTHTSSFKRLLKGPLLNNWPSSSRKMSTSINSSRRHTKWITVKNSDLYTKDSCTKNPYKDLWNRETREWLAGLIDGDGYFSTSKKGKARFEITMDAMDKKVLYLLKLRYKGSIKEISNRHAIKYKLENVKGLKSLINDVNGLIRNPIRLLQMSKVCKLFDLNLESYSDLTFNNGWFSGFIDSDGSISYNKDLNGPVISITQKNKYLLDPLIRIYGGRVRISRRNKEAFEYIIQRKSELFNLIDKYFSKYPLRTKKMKRVNLIKQIFLLKYPEGEPKPENDSQDGWAERLHKWAEFTDRWEKFKD